MKKLLFTSLMIIFTMGVFAASSDYYVDDMAVEETLESSTQVVFNPSSSQFGEDFLNMTSIEAGDPNPWVAFALSWFLGGLGIHRVYLGGKGTLILIYIITCGGIFGIIPLVDWIVLLIGAINDDIGSFVNNDSFIMWK